MFENGSDNGTIVQAGPKRQLTLFDSTCIIVGIIIGAGIYQSSPMIAGCVPGVAWLVGLWVLGGLISFVGALCFAELATAYPRSGGTYVYVTRAFGRPSGFLFAWSEFWIVRPGSIGAIAYVFAHYANRLCPLATGDQEYLALMAYAFGSVVVLTGINILGVREGKWSQNLLTTVKVLGLAGVVAVGLLFGRSGASAGSAAPSAPGGWDFRLAMILILFTYGGWNEMAYVGAEVRNPRKNIVRALVLGTVAVTLIYVLVNLAFVHALGFQGTGAAKEVAADVVKVGLGDWGAKAISVLICISALGAINGMVFTGARIYYAMGTEHRLYAWLGRWNRRLGTPVRSLVAQAAIALALVVGFGLTESGFESMVKFTTPVFFVFILLAGVSLFVLRYREPGTPRPYRVPLYPITPILFCLSSLFMLYSSVSFAIEMRTYEALWSVGLLVVGAGLCWYDPPVKPDGPPPAAPDGSQSIPDR